jgi:hypothetical protein
MAPTPLQKPPLFILYGVSCQELPCSAAGHGKPETGYQKRIYHNSRKRHKRSNTDQNQHAQCPPANFRINGLIRWRSPKLTNMDAKKAAHTTAWSLPPSKRPIFP